MALMSKSASRVQSDLDHTMSCPETSESIRGAIDFSSRVKAGFKTGRLSISWEKMFYFLGHTGITAGVHKTEKNMPLNSLDKVQAKVFLNGRDSICAEG